MGRTTEESRWWDEILHFVQNDTGVKSLSISLYERERFYPPTGSE
jgi:hypothetical protein